MGSRQSRRGHCSFHHRCPGNLGGDFPFAVTPHTLGSRPSAADQLLGDARAQRRVRGHGGVREGGRAPRGGGAAAARTAASAAAEGRWLRAGAEQAEEASVPAARSQRNIVGICDYHLFYKMSNSHPLRPFTAVGEIDHVHILSEHIGALLIGEEYGDVTFVVEKKRFPAHRVILAARCQYFRALLYGGMRESQPEAEIPLQDTTAEAFTMLLKYIYTGRATLTDEKEEVLLDFLSLAHKYGFPELEDSTSEYLCTILNIQNVCMTFDVASLYSLPKLTCMCCMFMDRNAQEVLSSEGFLSLSKTALLNIVLRDSFAAPEKDIFLALLNWCKHNSKENHAEIMQAVRLPLMSLTELLNVVRPSGLLSPDAILDAIKVRSESRDMDLNYRGMLIPEENIATMKYGAQVVKGELKSALLDGDTQNYDLDHGFSRHPIDDDCRSGIEIKLGQPSIINHIRILLWDRDSRSYSYFIEVSMDELDWIRVIDHSQYLCRSWQKLYFPARVCRYIRMSELKHSEQDFPHCGFLNVCLQTTNLHSGEGADR
nr:BTB/POZ domain-containing protein 9 [Camelus dromedarius]